MFTYGSLRRYIPFRIRNGFFLHISCYLGPYSPLFFFLLLNREINKHPTNTSNRSNWMSDSGLYDMNDQYKYSNTPSLSYIPYITLDRYHIFHISQTVERNRDLAIVNVLGEF
ncbi:hypothetical protein GQ457_14G005240 [Hibiscus cannabinus]